MSIAASQIDDLVLWTQEQLIKRGAFVDLTTDLSDYVAVREMWGSHKKQFKGGLDWRFDALMDHNHSARAVALYETDGSGINDAGVSGKVGPRFINANYTYDVLEPELQSDEITVVNYVKSKYTQMMVSFYEYLEEVCWGKPADSSDLKTPFGVAYWVVKNATEGFNGGNPAGFTDGRAGISTTTYPRWANWTGTYGAVSKEDLIRKMRRSVRKTKFISPLTKNEPTLGAERNGIYTTDNVIGLIEEALEAQNMSLGSDIASQDGRALFKGTPVTYAPYLDADSTDPVYMLNWKWLAIGVLEGWNENLSKPQVVAGKHTVRRVDLDASLNMVCTNLRKQAVFYKV